MMYHASKSIKSRVIYYSCGSTISALSAAELAQPNETSLLLASDQSGWRLAQVAPAEAGARLLDYCDLYRQGLRIRCRYFPIPVTPG